MEGCRKLKYGETSLKMLQNFFEKKRIKTIFEVNALLR